MTRLLLAPLLRWFGRLSYPRLFTAIALLLVVDVLVPDAIPLVDEILLGVGTLLLGKLKKPGAGDAIPRH